MTPNFSLTPLLTAFIASAVFVFFACRMASVWGLLDRPDARKQHDGAVPLIGGLSIFLGAFAALFLFLGPVNFPWTLFLPMLAILVLGVLDDRAELSVKVRIWVTGLTVLSLGFSQDLWLGELGDMFSTGPVVLSVWISVPLTIFAVIGVINAVNMIDGIDGLAGSLSFLALGIFGVLAWGAGQLLEAWVAILFATATVPYLLCNLRVCGDHNRVFMGDAGSMLLGFVIAWLALSLSQTRDAERVIAPITALWIFALPLMDTVAIMLRRILKRQSPFAADREHLHHIVLRMGYRDRHALLFIVMVSVVLSGIGLWMEFTNVSEWKRYAGFFVLFGLYFFAIHKIWKLSKAIPLLMSRVRSVVYRTAAPLAALRIGQKRLLLFFVDGVLIYLALASALIFRFGDWEAASRYFEGPLGAAILAAPLLAFPLFAWFGLYRSVIRYFGAQALWAVIYAVAFYTLLYAGGWLLLRTSGAIDGYQPLPMGVIVMHAVLLVLFVGGIRMLARRLLRGGQHTRQRAERNADPSERIMRVLIVGVSPDSIQLAAALQVSPHAQVFGFVQMDPGPLQDRILDGLPMLSLEQVSSFVAKHSITDVLLAHSDVDQIGSDAQRRVLLKLLASLQVRVRQLPSLAQVVRGGGGWLNFDELEVEDLLQHVSPQRHVLPIRSLIEGKTLLIFGAGGKEGAALSTLILRFRPAVLVLYEANEVFLSQTYQKLLEQLRSMEAELASAADSMPVRLVPKIVPIAGRVHDGARLREVLFGHKPDLVYYADGYQDVRMAAHNPSEVVKQNCFGVLSAAQAAMEAGIACFVLLSSHEAAAPRHCISASKRLSERVLQAISVEKTLIWDAIEEGEEVIQNQTRFGVVRLGSVLHEDSPLLTQFRQQIRDGGPVVLSNLEERASFLSAEEAAYQVLEATLPIQQGDMVGQVSEMDGGEAVKLRVLAERMIHFAGLQIKNADHPNGDIAVIEGPKDSRPDRLGRLSPSDSSPRPSSAALGGAVSDASSLSWGPLRPQLRALRIAVEHGDVEVMLALLQRLVPGYVPKKLVGSLQSSGSKNA